MRVAAGKLDQAIVIQVASESRAANGEVTKTWADTYTRYAKIRPLTGRERMNAQQPLAEMTHEIVIDYFTTVTPKMRVSFRDRIFDINAVIHDESRHEFTTMLCKEAA